MLMEGLYGKICQVYLPDSGRVIRARYITFGPLPVARNNNDVDLEVLILDDSYLEGSVSFLLFSSRTNARTCLSSLFFLYRFTTRPPAPDCSFLHAIFGRDRRMVKDGVGRKIWLTRLTRECLDVGMYELTSMANGTLSTWATEPVPVRRDLTKQRSTANYSHVEEELPGTKIPLVAELHEQLSDPRTRPYSQFELKDAQAGIRKCLPLTDGWSV